MALQDLRSASSSSSLMVLPINCVEVNPPDPVLQCHPSAYISFSFGCIGRCERGAGIHAHWAYAHSVAACLCMTCKESAQCRDEGVDGFSQMAIIDTNDLGLLVFPTNDSLGFFIRFKQWNHDRLTLIVESNSHLGWLMKCSVTHSWMRLRGHLALPFKVDTRVGVTPT